MANIKTIMKTLVVILVILILAIAAFYLFSWGRDLEGSEDVDLGNGDLEETLIDGPGGEPGEDAEADPDYNRIIEDLDPIE